MRGLGLARVVFGIAVGAGLSAGACNSQFGERGDETVPFPDPPGPRPTYGDTKSLTQSPPSISGGTLLIAKSGRLAFAADPDRDRVVLAELDSGAVTTIALNAGDEPGRAVEDAEGRVHVALRRGHGIATIDLATKKVVSRRTICAAPRGVVYHETRKLLYVACAGGELVGIGPTATTAEVSVKLDRDLRDVLVSPDGLNITTFRSAELLSVSTDGVLRTRFKASPMPLFTAKGEAQANVAYRAIPLPDGSVMMAHQRARDPNAEPISTAPGGYAGGGGGAGGSKGSPDDMGVAVDAGGPPPCGLGIVHSAVTTFFNGRPNPSSPISMAVLPVDVAFDPTRNDVAFVAAGNGHTPELPQIFRFERSMLNGFSECLHAARTIKPAGQAIAAAFSKGELVVQLREPAALARYSYDGALLGTIKLGGDSVEDTGHAVFHSNTGSFMACASCHPEGGDDGHVWAFADLGPRRTQNLRGGVSGTEPFHWNGELKDLDALMGEVFRKRMSGAQLNGAQVKALTHFMDGIPYIANSSPADAAAVARGKALFEDSKVACASCHSGPRTTNNASVDVGTVGVFQVPSLKNIAFRAPFMHTGCAHTLAERFAPECGGGDQHGKTSHLVEAQLKDLAAYLETL